MLHRPVSYHGEIKNVVQKCTFSFFYLLINKGFWKIKCQSQEQKIKSLLEVLKATRYAGVIFTLVFLKRRIRNNFVDTVRIDLIE